MHLSTSLTFAPELANLFIPSFACDIFLLQIFYSISPNRVSSSIAILLITSFIHPITEVPQIYMKQNVPKLTRMKSDFSSVISLLPCCLRLGQPVSNQPSVGRRPGRKWRPFLFAEVPGRIMLCLNRPSCRHKKDAYGWLLLFCTALAQGE